MSHPVTPARPAASPPRPQDPARGAFTQKLRRILADPALTDLQRAHRIAGAADEYAALLIERHARPANLSAGAA